MFIRRKDTAIIFGVCSAIAEHWELDVSIVRVMFTIGAFINIYYEILLYLLITIMTYNEKGFRLLDYIIYIIERERKIKAQKRMENNEVIEPEVVENEEDNNGK